VRIASTWRLRSQLRSGRAFDLAGARNAGTETRDNRCRKCSRKDLAHISPLFAYRRQVDDSPERI